MKTLNDEEISNALARVAANYIIGITALNKSDIPSNDFEDCVDKLTDNTICLASILYGKEGVEFVNNTAIKYGIRGL